MVYNEAILNQDTKYILDLLKSVRSFYGNQTTIMVERDGIYINGIIGVCCNDLKPVCSKSKQDRVLFDVIFKKFSVSRITMAAHIDLKYAPCNDVGEFFEMLEPDVKVFFAYHFDLLEKYRMK